MSVEVITRQVGQSITSGDEMNIQPDLGGISVQGDGKNPRIRIDDDGFKLFSASGAILAQISESGFAYNDGNGNKIADISTEGFTFYRNGIKIANIKDGFSYYDSDGNLRVSISQDTTTGYVRILTFDKNNNKTIIMGQNPADGEPVVAVVPSGKDVESELTA